MPPASQPSRQGRGQGAARAGQGEEGDGLLVEREGPRQDQRRGVPPSRMTTR